MIPDFFLRPDPEHPMAHNFTAVAWRMAVRLGHLRDDLEPLALNYGFGLRVLTVADAIAWAERRADTVLDVGVGE